MAPRGQEFLIRTPMGGFGKVEELVGSAIFLASDSGEFCYRHNICRWMVDSWRAVRINRGMILRVLRGKPTDDGEREEFRADDRKIEE